MSDGRSSSSDFEFLTKLGQGSFGTVHKVRRHEDDGLYVIKIVRIAELGRREQEEAINEVRILAQMDSPYVVRYYDSYIENESLYIVMEFCNKGDLQTLVRKAKAKDLVCLKEHVTWNISLQIILGLYYLHGRNVLHRDLKSANVFLNKSRGSDAYFDVKIGDLGVAKLLETSTAFAMTIVGTPYYLSPELCADQPYRDKSDVWALGVVLYECCTLAHPFEARNQCALIMKIINAPVPPLPADTVSPELSALLQKDPAARPRVHEILCEDTVRRRLLEHKLPIPDELQDRPVTHTLFPRGAGNTSRKSPVHSPRPAVTSQPSTQTGQQAVSISPRPREAKGGAVGAEDKRGGTSKADTGEGRPSSGKQRGSDKKPDSGYSTIVTGTRRQPTVVPVKAAASTAGIRGDRVRGPHKGPIVSKKARERHQIAPPSSSSSASRTPRGSKLGSDDGWGPDDAITPNESQEQTARRFSGFMLGDVDEYSSSLIAAALAKDAEDEARGRERGDSGDSDEDMRDGSGGEDAGGGGGEKDEELEGYPDSKSPIAAFVETDQSVSEDTKLSGFVCNSSCEKQNERDSTQVTGGGVDEELVVIESEGEQAAYEDDFEAGEEVGEVCSTPAIPVKRMRSVRSAVLSTVTDSDATENTLRSQSVSGYRAKDSPEPWRPTSDSSTTMVTAEVIPRLTPLAVVRSDASFGDDASFRRPVLASSLESTDKTWVGLREDWRPVWSAPRSPAKKQHSHVLDDDGDANDVEVDEPLSPADAEDYADYDILEYSHNLATLRADHATDAPTDNRRSPRAVGGRRRLSSISARSDGKYSGADKESAEAEVEEDDELSRVAEDKVEEGAVEDYVEEVFDADPDVYDHEEDGGREGEGSAPDEVEEQDEEAAALEELQRQLEENQRQQLLLEKMASDVRRKLLMDLGDDMFRRLHNLLRPLLLSASLKGSGGLDCLDGADSVSMPELAKTLQKHVGGSLERACKAAHRMKILLSFELSLEQYSAARSQSQLSGLRSPSYRSAAK